MSRKTKQRRSRGAATGRGRQVEQTLEGSLEQRVLIWLIGLKIAALIVVFDPQSDQAFDFAKSVVSHGFAWLIAAVLLVVVARYGLAVLPRGPIVWAVAVFLVANTVSAAFAESAYLALFGERFRFLGLTFLIDMAVLFVAVGVGLRRPRDWMIPAILVGVATVLAFGYAIVQRLGRDPITWLDDPQARPFAMFGNPDQFGLLLGLAFAVGIAAAVLGVSFPRVVRMASGVFALIALALAGVVATRASLIGVGAATVMVGLLFALSQRGRRRELLLGGATLIVAIVVGGAIVLSTPLGERVTATFGGQGTRDRVLIWQAALNAFADRPVSGYGPDSFGLAYPRYLQREAAIVAPGTTQNSAHSWLFQTAATTGALGLLSLAVLLVIYGVTARRELPLRPEIVGIAAVGSIAYWTQGLVSVGAVGVDWFPWVALGATVAGGSAPPAARRAMSAWSLPVAASVALVLAATGWSSIDASHHARSALVSLQRDDAGRGLTEARLAVAGDSGRAEHWNLVGLSYEQLQQWPNAANAYREAARRAPYESTYWINVAHATTRLALAGDQSLGGAATPLEAARTAVRLDPNNPKTNQALAEISNAFGDYEGALRAIVGAMSIYPSDPATAPVAADAAQRHPDKAKARMWLEQILALKETATARAALASVAFAQGDRDAARSNAQRALALDPNNETAKRVMTQLGG